MKRIKKYLIIYLLIMIIPLKVYASCSYSSPINVDICNSGCKIRNMEDAYEYIKKNLCNSVATPLTINFKEGKYNISNIDFSAYESVTIKGAGKDKTILYYSDDHGIDLHHNGQISISDLTIKSTSSPSKFAIRILDTYKQASIKNVNIDTTSDYGIFIKTSRKGTFIKNVEIKNTKKSAIYRNECKIEYKEEEKIKSDLKFNKDSSKHNGLLEITESNLEDNAYSLIEGSSYCSNLPSLGQMEDYLYYAFVGKSEENENNEDYKYTSRVNETKLSSIKATNESNSDYTPLIYVESNNNWNEIPESKNLEESQNGQVVALFEKNLTTYLNKKPSGIQLTDIIPSITTYESKKYEIKNTSIAKIENDKIELLSKGETQLTITSGNKTFKINLKVLESNQKEETIPKKGNNILLFSLIAVISIIIIVILVIFLLNKNKKIDKQKKSSL